MNRSTLRQSLTTILGLLCLRPTLPAAEPGDFLAGVKPILELQCLSCHSGEKPKGGLRLDTRENSLKGGEKGTALVPGDPQKSPLYTTTLLAPDHDDAMPPKGDRLSKAQTEELRVWIAQGAKWPAGVTLNTIRKVDFVKHIQPILEASCVSCHHEGHDKGGLRLDRKSLAMKGGETGPVIRPGKAKDSPLYTSTALAADNDDLMPPKSKGGPLPKEQIQLLRDWINQGALWPEGLTLIQQKAEGPSAELAATVQQIHEKILTNLTVTAQADMKEYKQLVPGTDVTYEMVPIPGGQFTMGSPDTEPGRQADEGPRHPTAIEPFWMGKYEVTWNEYELFMFPEEEKKIPTVCHALDQALDALDKDREFLTKGGVFTNDLIDAYIELKMQDVTRFRMTTHPIEFAMYYSV